MTRLKSVNGVSSQQRRGIAIAWLILFLPLFLLMLCLVIDIGNLWLARSELESALESAALAAVKEWGDASGGSTLVPRQVGQSIALANTVRGVPVSIALNYTAGGANNENTVSTIPSTTANLVFGSITSTSPTVVFDPTVTPNCGVNGQYAVLAQTEVNVTPICSSLLGYIVGPMRVRAQTTAYFRCSDHRPCIIRVGS